ncbi:MAG: hypothetical protein J6Y92_11660 [Lentisphaeria bacterium]|nr:hypothetical protein [Lentisphaeria bacterium]
MKHAFFSAVIAGLLLASAAVLSAAEVGGIVTPAKDLGKLQLVTGAAPKTETSLQVFLFFDPALPGAKDVLRMVDSIYEQALENKTKPASFYAISRMGRTRTASLELSKFRMPVYGDDKGDVYPEFAGTEVVIPFVLVADDGKIVWKGVPQELENVIRDIQSGKFSFDSQLKIEILHKDLQNAIQTGLSAVILSTADKVLALRPDDQIAIQAKLFVFESMGRVRENLAAVQSIASKVKDNADVRLLLLGYYERTGEMEKFSAGLKAAFKDFSGSPTALSRLLAYAFEQTPFGWLPVQDVAAAAATVKKAYAGTGGTTEAFSCEFSARAAYLALDIDTAIADQTRAVELFNGTEFLAEAKQALAFYKSVKAMKANP